MHIHLDGKAKNKQAQFALFPLLFVLCIYTRRTTFLLSVLPRTNRRDSSGAVHCGHCGASSPTGGLGLKIKSNEMECGQSGHDSKSCQN